MSVLVSSQDIYLSTQQSGSASSEGSDDGFNRFKMCLNTAPLKTTENEIGRLSLTQFSAYRNFYLVNKFNNRVYMTWKKGGVDCSAILELTKQDYGTIGEIAQEFCDQLIARFTHGGGGAGVVFTKGALSPALTYTKGQKGTGIFDVTLTTGAPHGITDLVLQCRQYIGEPRVDEQFGDSYALLGGKRIGELDATAQSFTISNPTTAQIQIVGFFPMQRSTTQYLYMNVSEATTNLESQNISSFYPLQDSHIITSNIIAKIPVNNEIVGYQLDTSTPYFVELDNKLLSNILFEIKDHHGRSIDTITDIATQGNLFSDLTLNWSVYARSNNVHELQAPFKNYNIEENEFAENVKRTTGSGF